MHELRSNGNFPKDLRVSISIAVIDQSPPAGRGGDLVGEIAPLADRAQPFVQEDERRFRAFDDFYFERAPGGGNLRHRSRLACGSCAPPPTSPSLRPCFSGRATGSLHAACATRFRRQ